MSRGLVVLLGPLWGLAALEGSDETLGSLAGVVLPVALDAGSVDRCKDVFRRLLLLEEGDFLECFGECGLSGSEKPLVVFDKFGLVHWCCPFRYGLYSLRACIMRACCVFVK